MEKLCRIRDIQRSVIKFERDFMAHYGICLNGAMALYILNQHSELTAGEISSLLQLTPSNTSKVISSIEDREYIERSFCSKDKRQMRFKINTKGKKLLDSIDCKKLGICESLDKLTN